MLFQDPGYAGKAETMPFLSLKCKRLRLADDNMKSQYYQLYTYTTRAQSIRYVFSAFVQRTPQ